MGSSASAIDGVSTWRSGRGHRSPPAVMVEDEGLRRVRFEERRIQRWLGWLRDGSEADKIAARRGLAGVFERRGMLAEAIELLERNVEAGVRSAETLRWLSRLYQAQGDEARSLEAAVIASQAQTGPPASEAPREVEFQTEPVRLRMIRRLMPYVLMLVGLGLAVGVVLWMLVP